MAETEKLVPFQSAILKLTSVCNLRCDYCYMFELADKTYTRIDNKMPVETALKALLRVEQYTQDRDLQTFNITLHGGEPTLWGRDKFSAFLRAVEELRGRGLSVDLAIQTNGMSYDRELLELFDRYGVGIGISLDGPQEYNDRHRVDHSGRGSYNRVLRNVSRMHRDGFGHLIGGFLSVADPSVPPKEYLDWICSLPLQPVRVSVLWPIEYHYGHPPPTNSAGEPYYGSWFAELFRLWWEQDDPDIYIRHFFDVIERFLGSRSHGDSIGNDSNDMLVINTDGRYEYPDYYRAAVDGGTRTRFSVQSDTLMRLETDPVFNFNLHLRDYLPSECEPCRFVDVCGGGFLPGRMDPAADLPARKSVLCRDHMKFFDKVASEMRQVVLDSNQSLENSGAPT